MRQRENRNENVSSQPLVTCGRTEERRDRKEFFFCFFLPEFGQDSLSGGRWCRWSCKAGMMSEREGVEKE